MKSETAFGHKSGKRSGFTLIEILVVIAIIALLAAILFPVFARARENARRASCQSNLKQIGLGILQYQQDYDEKMPPVSSRYCVPITQLVSQPAAATNRTTIQAGCDGSNFLPTWIEAAYPYLQSTQVLVCPSDASSREVPDYYFNFPYAYLPGPMMNQTASYGMNRFLGWHYPNTTTYAWGEGSGVVDATDFGDGGYPISAIQRPAEIVLVTEFAQQSIPNRVMNDRYRHSADIPDGDFNFQNPISADFHFTFSTQEFSITSNHLETTNMLFCDGHVKAIKVLNTPNAQPTASTEWFPLSASDYSAAVLNKHWHPDAP